MFFTRSVLHKQAENVSAIKKEATRAKTSQCNMGNNDKLI